MAPNAKERIRGEVPLTPFGAMCARLGIRPIGASSAPDAGRVERNHGTHQDRPIKKLRRKKIATHAQANEFLRKEYLPEHNRRFARSPAAAEDYHRATPTKRELDEIFRIETERTLGNDWVVRRDNRLYQVKRESRYAPARSKVTVCEWEDGAVRDSLPRPTAGLRGDRAATGKRAAVAKVHRHHRPGPPAPDHPWRQGYQEMRPRAERGKKAQ
jgi:hypothetical protein